MKTETEQLRTGAVRAEVPKTRGFKLLENLFTPETYFSYGRCELTVEFPTGQVKTFWTESRGNEFETFAMTFRQATAEFDPKLSTVKLVVAQSKVGSNRREAFANLTFSNDQERWTSNVTMPRYLTYEAFCAAYVQGVNTAPKTK